MRLQESIAMEIDLHRAIDGLPGLVWTASSDGCIDFVNQRWCEYTGISLEESFAGGWMQPLHPDDQAAALAAWQSCLDSGSAGDAEARIRRHDGVYRSFLVEISPLRDESGEILEWCGLNTDIEDHKGTGSACLLQLFRMVVDSLPTPVLLVKPDGGLLHQNSKTIEIYGVESWEKHNYDYLVHPDDRHLSSFAQGAMARGEPFELEWRTHGPGDVFRWTHTHAAPVKDSQGRIVFWCLHLNDIDDRKRAEALLAGEKRLLEMVAKGLPILDPLCQLVEEIDNECHSGILLIDSATDRFFRKGGASKSASTYMDALDGAPGTGKNGPCKIAATTKRPVIVADMASDLRWSPQWRELSMAYELRACWSTPILSRSHEALGAFAIYRKVPGKPTKFQRDMMGRIAHIASIAIERERSDKALRRSEESFRTMMKTTPDGVSVIARDGTILQANWDSSDLMMAPEPDALVGKCAFDFIVPEHRQSYIKFHEDVCNGERGFFEFDVINTAGDRRHLELHAAPMHYSDGSTVRLGVVRDITARKRADEELRRSAALMAKAQQLSACGSFYWCTGEDEIIWSEQLYRMHDIALGMRITLPLIATRVHPEDLGLMDDVIEQVKTRENLRVDYRLLLPDGTVRYLHLEANATPQSNGEMECVGAIQDVTERRQSEEALSTLRFELAHVTRVNSLGALTASIAHEINQPLAGIITNASTGLRMLGSEPPNVEGALETLRRSLRDGRRASEVMTRLRVLFSKRAVSKDAVDLVEAVREVVELLRTEIRRNRIVMRMDVEDDVPRVTGDRVQLQQVILNLVMNASEAMRGVDDRVRDLLIRIEHEDQDKVLVAVTDTGKGFAPEQASKLFDPFFSTKKDGMGIGLSVCRTIIESHGGGLRARPNEGHGATFTFCIPVRSDGSLAAQHPDAGEHGGGSL
jgi:PAS domain S-box-containing protein